MTFSVARARGSEAAALLHPSGFEASESRRRIGRRRQSVIRSGSNRLDRAPPGRSVACQLILARTRSGFEGCECHAAGAVHAVLSGFEPAFDVGSGCGVLFPDRSSNAAKYGLLFGRDLRAKAEDST